MKATIAVYLDTSAFYEYEIEAATPEELQAKARDHMWSMAARGVMFGPHNGELQFFPPHRISKMKATGDLADSKYRGTWKGA